jgi:hypothetical protein
MNISEARQIARSLFAGADREPKVFIQALHVLELEGGDEGYATVEAAYDRFPGLLNWDAKGNYVGNVANENGWTA